MVELVSIDCDGDTARLAMRSRETRAVAQLESQCVLASAVAQLAQQAGVRRIVISRHSHGVKR